MVVGLVAPKGDRLDWAVQKLTEVGVDAIVVLTSDRGVVRWDPDRTGRQLARLATIARQAAMQSRRPTVPPVWGPLPLSAAVPPGGWSGPEWSPGGWSGPGPSSAGGAPVPGPVALAEPGAPPPTLATPTVLVGPEGGWSTAELGAVPHRVGLVPGVLRTETAAVVAAALLVAARSATTPATR